MASAAVEESLTQSPPRLQIVGAIECVVEDVPAAHVSVACRARKRIEQCSGGTTTSSREGIDADSAA
jgi:hypothetical protein